MHPPVFFVIEAARTFALAAEVDTVFGVTSSNTSTLTVYSFLKYASEDAMAVPHAAARTTLTRPS